MIKMRNKDFWASLGAVHRRYDAGGWLTERASLVLRDGLGSVSTKKEVKNKRGLS